MIKSTRPLIAALFLLAACSNGSDLRPATLKQALGNPPVNTVPLTTQNTNEDSPLHFLQPGNGLSVTDSDSATVTVQIIVTNGTFTAGTAQNVTVSGNGTFSVILTGPPGGPPQPTMPPTPASGIWVALDDSIFQPAPDFNGAATLQMNSSDNNGNSDLDVVAINVTAFNDPPLNNVPSATQAATEDQPRAFTLSVNDVDLAGSPLAVTLSSSNGTLITLPTVARLTFTTGDGTDDASLAFEGTLPDVNAALNGLTVTPPLNFIGNSTLVISSNDRGATGAGMPGSDTDTINISWAAVNDAPVNQVPGPQTTNEEVAVGFGSSISVSDVDATTTFLQVTLNANGGTLDLGNPGAVSFNAGDGSADATMTFTGTLANLNSALAGTSFVPAPNFTGNASVTVITNDLGNSGSGGARQDTDVITITVAGVNDAPVISVPGTQGTNEDVSRVFSPANGNPIAISDVDATSLRVTITATDGGITLAGTNGLTFQTGDGTADVTMTFDGALSAINSSLAGLTFAPTANFAGPATLTLTANDLGATGSGGPLSATRTITINVNEVNDPPDAVNDALTLLEDAAPTDIAVLANDSFAPDVMETLTLTAAGTPANGTATLNGTSIRYTPNANFFGTDSFSYTITDGRMAFDTATVVVTVTSVNDAPSAVADSFTVLQNSGATALGVLSNDTAAPDVGETLSVSAVTPPASGGTTAISGGGTTVTYTPPGAFTGTDTFTYTLSDGNGGTATATVTVTVSAVNTRPVNTLPPPQLTIEDNQLVFSSVGGNAITVADANNTTLTVQVSVTNGTFTLGSVTGLTVSGNGSPSVTLQGTISALNSGLNNARYQPSPNFNGPATLTVNTNDVTGESDLDVLTLTVSAVNDTPVNTTPGTTVQAATEDVPRTFTTFSVSDVDVGAGQLQVTLTADNGTVLSLAGTGGLAFSQGDGTLDATLTFVGTLPDLNAALNGLTVTPPANFIGSSSVVMTTNDQGNTGAGGPGQDTDTVNLGWGAVNDPPVNAVPVAQTTTEEVALGFSSAAGNALSLSDVDASGGLLQVTLSAAGGTLTLGGFTGLTFNAGDGTADATMTFTGTLASLNAALDGTVFTPAPDFAGAGSVTLSSNDLGNSGSGGARSDTDVVTVNVSGVNDAPVNTVPGAQTTNEDVPRVFSAANGNLISVADVDAPSLQLSLSANDGTLTLANRAGLTFQAGDGTADATMTFQGTVGALNTALNGLQFTPSPNFFGAASITLLTSDLGATGAGGTLTRSSTVTVTVTSVNDPPDAVNDAVTVNEDAPVTDIFVLSNDTFAPDVGETLTLTAVTAPANGTAAIAGTRVTYQPAPNYNGADSFSYTISDGNGGTDTATVAITVTSVNDVPTATADSFTVLQGSGPNALGVLSNDSAAPDLGETLTIVSNTAPANGTVVITGGGTGLTYQPAGAFTGTDTFSYTISDGRGGSASALVTMTVSMVNTRPVNTLPPPQVVIEDTQLTFSSANGNALSVADSNNASLTVQLSVTNGTFTLGGVTGLTVTGNGTASVTAQGTIAALNTAMNNSRYAPAANYNGAATLTMSTNDTSGETDLDVLTITVSAVNDAPVNTLAATTAAVEDTPRTFSTISIADVDVGPAQLQVSLTSDNGVVITLVRTTGLSFSAGDGTADATMTFTGTLTNVNAALNGLTLTPPADYIGTSTLVLVTNDLGSTGGGGPQQDTNSTLVTWAADNDPPINSVPGPQTVAEEGPLVFSAAAGNGLSTSDVDVAAGLVRVTLSATNGRVSLGNPSAVTFSVGTGTGDTTMTFQGTLATVNGALDGSSFTGNPNFNGAATVTLLTSDLGNTGGTAKTDSDVVSITVTAVNDAPVNTLPLPQVINEDATLLFSTTNGNLVTVADVDAAVLQVTLSTTNGTITLITRSGITFQAGDGSAATSMTFTGPLMALNTVLNGMRFAAAPNFNGLATLTILSRDLGATGAGGALSDEDTVNITVTPVNDPPTAAADAYTLAEDAPATDLLVLANDSSAPDTGETLTITNPGAPAHGTVTTNGARLTYTPVANYFGPDTLTYTISDGNGGTATAVVSLTITAVNDPPDAVDDVASVPQGSMAVAVPVLMNDTFAPDTSETLTITAATVPLHGTVAFTGTSLTYRPVANYSGPDTFRYTISDGNGGTDTANVSITVTPVNATPVAVADTLTVAEDAVGSVAVLANDTGLTNGPVTVVVVTQPANGAAVLMAGDTIQYTPRANYAGGDTFTYRVTDTDGDTSVGTVTVTVTPVNDVPDAGADAVTTDEDTSARVDVLANDTGAVDLPLTVTVLTPPAHGTTMVEVDRSITYAPAANYHGPDTFTYQVSDGNADRSSAVVSVTVTPVNDAPVAVSDTAAARVATLVAIDVKANDTDVDGDTLTVTAVTTPAHGTAVIATDGRVSYTPAAGYTGPDTFRYTVSDSNGGTADGTVTVGVGVDTDGDGLIDLDEVAAGTDPALPDTDGDLIRDGTEVNVTRTDPLDDDSDDDGLLDGNEDLNFNGVLDAAETDPKVADSDGDGLLDGTEKGLAMPQGGDTVAAKFVADADPASKTDPRKADTDSGGVPDGMEDVNHNGRVDTGERDPNKAADDTADTTDTDGDSVPDATDNCPMVANMNQADADADGIGDACDTPQKSGCGCGFGGEAMVALAVAVLLGRRARRRSAP